MISAAHHEVAAIATAMTIVEEATPHVVMTIAAAAVLAVALAMTMVMSVAATEVVDVTETTATVVAVSTVTRADVATTATVAAAAAAAATALVAVAAVIDVATTTALKTVVATLLQPATKLLVSTLAAASILEKTVTPAGKRRSEARLSTAFFTRLGRLDLRDLGLGPLHVFAHWLHPNLREQKRHFVISSQRGCGPKIGAAGPRFMDGSMASQP